MNLGPTELIIVLVIVLVLFGGARLPKLAKSIGEAKREFAKGVDEGAKETPKDTSRDTPKGTPEEPRAGGRDDEKVTLTKAELEALIAERQDQARRDGTASAP